jgi:ribonucleotide reductase beta subunit family protein with ferritin-like domain
LNLTCFASCIEGLFFFGAFAYVYFLRSACFGARNPFSFMELQDVQELTNFFERKVSAYQVAVQGEVAFDQTF